MQNNSYNGRVNFSLNDYTGYNLCANTESTDGFDVIPTTMEHTPISALFFSKTNIDALQQGIINSVYNQSDGKYNICKQDEIELKIIMRSMYLDSLRGGVSMPSANWRNNSVLDKVRSLNKSVIDWSVPRIISNIQQYERYKKDINFYPEPMQRPSYLTLTGTRTLEFKSFF